MLYPSRDADRKSHHSINMAIPPGLRWSQPQTAVAGEAHAGAALYSGHIHSECAPGTPASDNDCSANGVLGALVVGGALRGGFCCLLLC